MIKLKINNDKDLDKDLKEKNIVKVNLTPDIILVKEALEYFDSNQYKQDIIVKRLKYIEFIDSEKDFEHNQIVLYDDKFNKLDKAKYEYIGSYDSTTMIWSWAWAIPSMKKKNTTIIRKILNYGVELEPTNNFLKTELITSRFRVTNKIQLDIYSAIVSYLSKKPRIVKIKLFVNIKIIENIYDKHDKNNVKPIYIDVSEPLINKNASSEDQYRYTEYYLFLLD
jgi:hypothetical protein